MSTSIDERIVAMKFDNRNFEKNAAESIQTIDLLKSKLNFEDVQEELNNINTSKIKQEFSSLGDINTSKFETVLDKLEYRMSGLGIFTGRIVQNVADDIYKIVKLAGSGIDKVVSFAKGGIIQGGYSRASNIQQAKFQLEGLGIAWKDISADIDFAVKDTAYSLDAAAKAASQLVTSGLMPGYQYKTLGGQERDIDTLAMVLRAASGVAAMSGGAVDYSQITDIFVNAISKGKFQGDEFLRIAQGAGINAKQTLADYYNDVKYQGKTNWTADEIETMASKGQIDPMHAIEALYEKFGEHAVKANETLSGVMANTKSALARIGANFFEPIIANSGPLVTLFEVLRRSINDLNAAISPVVKLFANDVVQALEKITNPFIEKEYERDENGEIKMDEKGNPMYTYKWKKFGGIFSSWLEPWHEETEVDSGLDRNHIPTMDFQQTYMEQYSSRAEKFTSNMRTIFTSTGKIMYNFFSNNSKAFKQVFPEYKGMADLIVKVTTKIADKLEWISNLDFWNPPDEWKDSGWYAIIRGIFSGIDIIYRFGKALVEHFIKPIFSAGKTAASSLGIMDWIVKLSNAVYEFDQRLKNGEDVFGHFFEFIKNKLTQLKNFLGDLFTGKLNISEKLSSLKETLSTNISIPGWDSIANVFRKIGDAIGYAFDKLKEFFGFGKKEDQLEFTTGAGGYATGGALGLLNPILPNAGAVAGIIEKFGNKEDTENLPTIGERISGFFGKIKDAIMGFDFSGASGVLTTFNIALISFVGVLAYGLYRIFKIADVVIIKLPVLANRVVTAFETLMDGITLSLKAYRTEKYSQSLLNFSISIGILIGAFTVLFGVIYLIEKLDAETGTDSLKKAGLVIGQIALLLGGFMAMVMILANKLNSSFSVGNIRELKELNLTTMQGTMIALGAILKAFVIGLIAISALLIILGALPEDLIRDGAIRLGAIAGVFALLIIGIVAITELLSGAKLKGALEVGKNLTTLNYASGILGVAGVIAAFTVGVMLLVIQVAILGALPSDVWNDGIRRLGWVAGGLLAFILILEVVLGILDSKAGLAGSKQIVATLFGIATLITAFAFNALAIVGALKLLDFVDSPVKNMAVLAAIFAVMGYISEKLLGTAYRSASKFTDFLGIALMMSFMSASLLIIAHALQKVGDVSNLLGSVLALGILFGEIGGVLYLLSKLNTGDMVSVATSITGIMIGLLAMAGAIAIAGKLTWGEIGKGAVVITGSLIIISGVALALNKIANSKVGKGGFGKLGKLAGGIALLSLALIPAAVAIAALMVVMKTVDIDADEALAIGGTLGIVIASLGVVAFFLNKFTTNSKGGAKHVLSSLGSILSLCLLLVPVTAAISLLFAAYKMSGISLEEAVGIMAAFALAIFAIATGAAMIVGGVANIGAKTTEASLAKATRSMMAMMAAIAILMLGLGATILIIAKSGAGAMDIAVAVVAIAALGIIVGALTKFLTKTASSKEGTWGKERMNKTIEMLVTAISGIVILAGVAALLTFLDVGSLSQSVLIIAALGVIVGALTWVLTKMATSKEGTWGKDRMNKTIEILVTSVAGLAILGMTAGILSTLDQSKLWSSVGVVAVLGVVMAGLTALLAFVAKFLEDVPVSAMLFPLVTMAGVTLSIVTIAFTLAQINDLDMEKMNQQLMVFGIGLAAVVVVMSIAGALLSKISPGSFLVILSLAAALVAAGVMFFLVGEGLKAGAEALDMFVNTLGDEEKSKKAEKAFETFGSALATGLAAFIHKVAEVMPQIMTDLGTIFQSIVHAVGEGIKMIAAEIANVFADEEFKKNIGAILDGLVDIIFDSVLPALGKFATRLGNEVLLPLGKQIGESLWNALNLSRFEEQMEAADKLGQKAIEQSLVRKLMTEFPEMDAETAKAIVNSRASQHAIQEYLESAWVLTPEQRAEYIDTWVTDTVNMLRDADKELLRRTQKAEVGADKVNDKGVQNGEYYQARTARNAAQEIMDKTYNKPVEEVLGITDESVQETVTSVFEKAPQWAWEAMQEAVEKGASEEQLKWIADYANKLENEEIISGNKLEDLMDYIGEIAVEGFDESVNNMSEHPLRMDFISGTGGFLQRAYEELGMTTKNGKTVSGKTVEIGNQTIWGLIAAFEDSTNKSKMGDAVIAFVNKNIIDAAKSEEALDIASPSKKMKVVGAFATDGLVDGMLSKEDDVADATSSLVNTINTGLNPMYNAGKSDGEAYGEGVGAGIEDAIKNSGIKDKIFDNIKGKINIDDLKGKVGLGKGLKENVEGVKSIWETLKKAVTNENGDFDLGFITEGIDLEETLMSALGLGDITSQFGAAGVGNIDTSAFNMDLATQSLDMSSWKNEFEGFDVNDAISSNTLDLKIDLDTSAYDDFYKESATGNLIRGIPTQTYQRIPTNSSYVNNYTYNQNITSTQPLSTREVNRNTQLALTRNRWNVGGGGGLRR